MLLIKPNIMYDNYIWFQLCQFWGKVNLPFFLAQRAKGHGLRPWRGSIGKSRGDGRVVGHLGGTGGLGGLGDGRGVLGVEPFLEVDRQIVVLLCGGHDSHRRSSATSSDSRCVGANDGRPIIHLMESGQDVRVRHGLATVRPAKGNIGGRAVPSEHLVHLGRGGSPLG